MDLDSISAVAWRRHGDKPLSEPCTNPFHWRICSTMACFLFLARSNLRLCSANHRPGYFSNLDCDWLSIVWAYSEQEREKGPRPQWVNGCLLDATLFHFPENSYYEWRVSSTIWPFTKYGTLLSVTDVFDRMKQRIEDTINTLEQNGWCFAGDNFKCIFLIENIEILHEISLNYVPEGEVYSVVVQSATEAERRICISEPNLHCGSDNGLEPNASRFKKYNWNFS